MTVDGAADSGLGHGLPWAAFATLSRRAPAWGSHVTEARKAPSNLDLMIGGPLSAFAVNVDPVESGLTRADPELLPNQFQQDLRSDNSAPPKLPGAKPWPMFRLLLGSVLALVLLETFLAWLFDKTSA